MGAFFSNLKEYFKFSSSRGSATLSGALVFFILLGIIPICYISSLILSFMGTELTLVAKTFSNPLFNEVTDYVLQTAGKLGAGGNAVAFFVALFSSANVFYHLKLSGVILYNYPLKHSVFLRIISIIATFIIVCAFSVGVTIYLAIMPLIMEKVGQFLFSLINSIVALVSVLLLAIVINFYACPFKLKFNEIIKGSVYTSVFSFLATFFFFVYINNFSSLDDFYGKIAIIVIFLSWLYLMAKGFIEGITINVFLMTRSKVKNNKNLKVVSKTISS